SSTVTVGLERMLPSLQRSSPGNPGFIGGFPCLPSGVVGNPLTGTGERVFAPVLWGAGGVGGVDFLVRVGFGGRPRACTMYKKPSLPTAALGKSEPPSSVSRGAHVLAAPLVALLSGEQVTLAFFPPRKSLKAI